MIFEGRTKNLCYQYFSTDSIFFHDEYLHEYFFMEKPNLWYVIL
jgi:hypothetical protein